MVGLERDTDRCSGCGTGYRHVWWVSVDTGCVWCGMVGVERNTDRTGAVGMKRDGDSVMGVKQDTDRCGGCETGYRQVWWT